jgi:hypothetical protein
MISLFSIFKVMEHQRNFTKEPYDPSEYKLTWMLVFTFLALHVYFIYIYIYIYISNMHILQLS